MRKVAFFLVMGLLVAPVGPALSSQPQGTGPPLLNLQFLDVSVKDLIHLLSMMAGVQVVVDPGIDTERKISLYLRQQPVEKALQIIAEQIGAQVRKRGDVFIIEPRGKAPPEELARPEGPVTAPPPPPALPEIKPVPKEEREAVKKEEPKEVTEAFEVKHVNAGLLALQLGGTTSSGKNLLDYIQMGTIPTVPVFAEEASLKPVGVSPQGERGVPLLPPSDLQALLGLPRGAKVTDIRYQIAPGVAPGVAPGIAPPRVAAPGVGVGAAALLPEGVSFVMAYEPLNLLLVRGTPEAIRQFKEILALLDVPPKQVLIEAQFVDVSTSVEEAFGIDWILSTGEVTAGVVGLATGAVLTVRYDAGRFGATLAAALRTGKARVVNAPRVATLNNMPAIIAISTVYPIVISFTYVLPGGVTRTIETVMFFPVTSFLVVWPTIHPDDSITIMVVPQLVDIIGTVRGPGGVELPQFTVRTLQTVIRVKDGESIVIGGLIRKSDTIAETHTPWLSRLPIVGALFRGRSEREHHTQILIFLTPHIIRAETPAIRPAARVE